MSLEQLAGYLSKTARRRGGHTVEELLSGIFTKNLAVYLVKSILGRSMADKISSLRREEIILLAKRNKRLEFPSSGCAGVEKLADYFRRDPFKLCETDT